MDTAEIPLLHCKVRFRRLSWREEFAPKPDKNEDPTLNFLAHAMVEVSGMEPIKDAAAALQLLKALPPAIRSRVWLIYRGDMPENRRFITKGLYQTPEPAAFNQRVKFEEEERAHRPMPPPAKWNPGSGYRSCRRRNNSVSSSLRTPGAEGMVAAKWTALAAHSGLSMYRRYLVSPLAEQGSHRHASLMTARGWSKRSAALSEP